MIQQAPEGTQLTIRQTLDRLKEQYPSAEFLVNPDKFPYTKIRLENGWTVSLAYDRLACCGAHFEKDPLDSTTVEVAIFRPDLSWFIAEGMNIGHEAKTGVFCWQDLEFVFRTVAYISSANTADIQEGRMR